MSDNVEPVTHEILKSIQASIAKLRAEMRAGFDELKSVDAKERRNSAGPLVMMRAAAGDFDMRVNASEARVALEERV